MGALDRALSVGLPEGPILAPVAPYLGFGRDLSVGPYLGADRGLSIGSYPGLGRGLSIGLYVGSGRGLCIGPYSRAIIGVYHELDRPLPRFR